MKTSGFSDLLTANIVLDATQFNAGGPFVYTIENTSGGWLTDVQASVHFDLLDSDGAVAVVVTSKEDWGEMSGNFPIYREAMNGWTGNAFQASEVMGESIPRYYFFDSGVGPGDDTISTGHGRTQVKKWNVYEEVSEGSNINIIIYTHNLGNAESAGGFNLEITVEAGFSYGCVKHGRSGNYSERGHARGAEVAILANMSTGTDRLFWTPPCDGRVGNVRLTMYNQQLMNSWDYLYFGKSLFTDAKRDSGKILRRTDGLYLYPVSVEDEDASYIEVLTDYQRGPEYIHKGEMMQLKLDTGVASAEMRVQVEFDFIPDFGANTDFSVKWEVDDQQTGVMFKPFMIPFDCFIEEVEVAVRMNVQDDLDIHFMVLKDLPEMLGNMNVLTGNLLSASGIASQQRSVLPPAIFGTITMGEQGDMNVHRKFSVHDYLPAGSFICWTAQLESPLGTGDIDLTLDIHGKGRVKSQRLGRNYYDGPFVMHQEGTLSLTGVSSGV